MSARKQEIRIVLLQILDAVLVACALWLAWAFRANTGLFEWIGQSFGFAVQEIRPFDDFVWMLYVLMPALPLMLDYQGFYSHRNQENLAKLLRKLAVASVLVLLIFAVLLLLVRSTVDSRAVIVLALVISFGLIVLRNRLEQLLVYNKNRLPGRLERVLLAGHGQDMQAFAKEFEAKNEGVFVVGKFDLISGSLDDFVELLHKESVERVFFCAEHLHFHRMEDAVRTCELEGVEAWLSTRFLRATAVEPKFDQFADHPMLVFRNSPDYGWRRFVKEVMDRVAAFVLIVISLPLWVFVIIGIKRSDPGPVFFQQQRGGKNGKPFPMYKFRSMYIDAEARRKELESQNKMSGPVFKVDNDPRIFSFGSFIRKTSLDELPQLINVLLGHMSLVGPRPLPVYEVAEIAHSRQRRRLSVKPGITCLWQISGRNEITDFDDWCALDLKYIDNWSLWLDIRILFGTIPVVLLRSGAR